MSNPLKQLEEFDTVDELNAWLSARVNDKYETEILVLPQGQYGCHYAVIYWELPNAKA
ncbi:hypothetical protein [Pseudarthrobacter sp. H2]|uniref:hypothetical protein n=1 Tax=Pseudarthrobacter sp. H2 TaxID=3418415 RepID=UPI003CF3C7D5